MASVSLHESLSGNATFEGYARELTDYLNGVSLSGRLGKNGGFERNKRATESGILKIHIKVPGESFWDSSVIQRHRTSNNYLVYARHWDFSDIFQIIAIVTPDAHERIDGLLPGIVQVVERDFQDLNERQLSQLTFY